MLFSFWMGGYIKKLQFDRYFDAVKSKRIMNDPYNLVAPLIGSESPSALEIGRFQEVHGAIKAFADSHADEIETYSIYYRDINSSQWIGINEDEAYVPASLLKIALAISFLKQEEENPEFKNTRRIYTQKIADTNLSTKYLEPSTLIVGRAYAVDDLLNKMMVESDNGAKDLLYSSLDKKYFYDLFRLIGIQQPNDPLKYTLSTKDYAFFLRILYNGTYLTAEDSQRLLQIMTQSKFTNGLVAGAPSHITVAHKYGTFTLTDSDENKKEIELHDCGIIYSDRRPFILCVMTKGTNADKLAAFIAGVASTTYAAAEDYFDN